MTKAQISLALVQSHSTIKEKPLRSWRREVVVGSSDMLMDRPRAGRGAHTRPAVSAGKRSAAGAKADAAPSMVSRSATLILCVPSMKFLSAARPQKNIPSAVLRPQICSTDLVQLSKL
jgi:hypothetical protein